MGYRLLFIFACIAIGGCSQDLAAKYGYREPQIPRDIPHFASPVRARGNLNPDGSPIDLHQEYLVSHKEGFREAAREYEEDGAFKYDSIESIKTFDATRVAVQGYWDGYSEFRKRIGVASDTSSDNAAQD
jgi:hypothetical protein